jgi:hypothetical protein
MFDWCFKQFSFINVKDWRKSGDTFHNFCKKFPSSRPWLFKNSWRKILCRLFSKRPKTIFVLRKNQLSSFYYACGIAYFYVSRKWFLDVLKITYSIFSMRIWISRQKMRNSTLHFISLVILEILHFSGGKFRNIFPAIKFLKILEHRKHTRQFSLQKTQLKAH